MFGTAGCTIERCLTANIGPGKGQAFMDRYHDPKLEEGESLRFMPSVLTAFWSCVLPQRDPHHFPKIASSTKLLHFLITYVKTCKCAFFGGLLHIYIYIFIYLFTEQDLWRLQASGEPSTPSHTASTCLEHLFNLPSVGWHSNIDRYLS